MSRVRTELRSSFARSPPSSLTTCCSLFASFRLFFGFFFFLFVSFSFGSLSSNSNLAKLATHSSSTNSNRFRRKFLLLLSADLVTASIKFVSFTTAYLFPFREGRQRRRMICCLRWFVGSCSPPGKVSKSRTQQERGVKPVLFVWWREEGKWRRRRATASTELQ